MKAEFITSAIGPVKLPPMPHVVFMGKSNVGKSSLINALTGRKRLARVSQTPGKTQLINFFLVENTFYLVDLPGYGYAKISKTKREGFGGMVNSYLESEPRICLAVLLFDVRHGPNDNDRMLMDWLLHKNINMLYVATKTDKFSRQQLQNIMKKHAQLGDVIGISSRTRAGIGELFAKIMDAAANV